MANLQERLDKAFGALNSITDQPAWKPSAQQIFRSGAPPDDVAASSDEEYEEKQRRESVPGLAQSLVDEDEPDEEGFKPSTAFCRALDAEEEYNEIDEMATGLISRRKGEALPPRDTQVLEDNPYELRMGRQQGVERAAAGGAAEEQPTSMDVEVAVEEASVAAAPAAAGPGRSSLAGSSSGELLGEKKKVRFEGVQPAYVPPVRREGYQQRFTELPPAGVEQPDAEDVARGGASLVLGPGGRPRQQQSLSHVPDHVKNPAKYTCYVLDEPLVVGGGVGQLAREGQNQRHYLSQAAAAGGAAEADTKQQEQEPERWEGPVGAAGSVQFKPREQQAGGAAGTSGKAAGSTAGQPLARRQGPQVTVALEGEDMEAEGAEEEAGAGGAEMQTDAAKAASKRSYRKSRAAAEAE